MNLGKKLLFYWIDLTFKLIYQVINRFGNHPKITISFGKEKSFCLRFVESSERRIDDIF